MATSLNLPEKFNFGKPEEWPRWVQRFERYIAVAKITDQEQKINTMIYAMGQNAEDILLMFGLSAENGKKYDVVRQKFDDHFMVRRNTIYERARFNSRNQGETESIETFITDLYRLVQTCDYGDKEEEFLRDRIVVGIADRDFSLRLQMDDKLTLQTCLAKVRSKELISKQASMLNDSTKQLSRADAVHSTRRDGRHDAPQQSSGKKKKKPRKKITSCYRCGKEPHKFVNCPAKDSKCSKCGNVGHWQQFCNTKMKVKEVVEDEYSDVFLGEIVTVGTVDSDFDINLTVNEAPIKFKIDCGADVSVISHGDYKRIADGIKLLPADKILVGANGQPLEVMGCFECKIENTNSDSCMQKLYVVPKLRNALLGKPAIKALNLLQRTNAVSDTTSFKDKVLRTFPKLFKGLGTLPGEYEITLKPDAKPFSINAARRIAQPLLPKVKQALDSMEAAGVIRKLGPNEVTPYLSPIVVVPKPNGKMRVCVDLSELNKHIERPRYELPTVDETLAKIGSGTVFTKLDANSGFFQIKLADSSQLLTSFLTPWGRYCHLRCPFGITSGPEYFQNQMHQSLDNAPNTACLMDDICVSSPDIESHEKYLFPVLQKLQDSGVTLNPEKCEFLTTSLTFVGHTIDKDGISADPKKVKSIKEMRRPSNITELRRFMGMVNQLGKFSNRLAELSAPLRGLLSSKNEWIWGPEQDTAFEFVKTEICSPRVLAAYNPNFETKIRSDASKNGYGAVLLQRSSPEHEFKPVYFASKSLTPAEQNYSIIEKEAGAIVYACTKFDKYILGMTDLKIETDQKPLVSLLGKQSLDKLPPRIVRFRLALMRYNFSISHVPGKEMHTSDCLSRASITDSTGSVLVQECEEYVNALLSNLPCTDRRLDMIKECQHDDEICLKLLTFTRSGWPERSDIPQVLQPYYQFRDEFTVCNGLLLKCDRIVIPTCLRVEMLDLLHQGHFGVEKCRKRALVSIWWPGLSKQIEEMVRSCATCARNQPDQAEPLMPTPLPDRPFQRLAADICQLDSKLYLVIVDYYSKYIEFAYLKDMTSQTLIKHLKSCMSRHGICETLVTDNQFATAEMADFSAEWGFTHITSSPRYARSNGMAENAVKQFKNLLKKNQDPHLALLIYRATPQHNGLSPAEMCMSRKLRTTLPQAPNMLKPFTSNEKQEEIRAKDDEYKLKMKINYDTRHRARELPPLQPGDNVIVRDRREEAVVKSPARHSPRSYVVTTPSGNDIRRNRRDIIHIPPGNNTNTPARPARERRPPSLFGAPIPWDAVRK